MRVDPTDLVTAAEAAPLLGLAHATGVHTYWHRYPDFPEPVIRKGRCVLWLRAELVAWAASDRGRRAPSDAPGGPS
jgi:predicted DNA-binding transcriptional regulator AlpA